jgi:hypothetical protein
MNERIKELVEQATSIQGPTPYNPLTFEVFDKEKFAELIVQECADIAFAKIAKNGEAVVVASAILDSFGVER